MTRLVRMAAPCCVAGALTLMVLTGSTPQRLPNNRTIMASAGTGGTISPTGAVSVTHGSSQTFTMTAGGTFKVNRVLVDGVSVGTMTSYTFNKVKADHTIDVSFTYTGSDPSSPPRVH